MQTWQNDGKNKHSSDSVSLVGAQWSCYCESKQNHSVFDTECNSSIKHLSIADFAIIAKDIFCCD